MRYLNISLRFTACMTPLAAVCACTIAPSDLPDKELFSSTSIASPEREIRARDLVQLRDIGGYFGSKFVSPDGAFVAFQLQQPDLAANNFRTGWFVASSSSSAQPVFVGDGGKVIFGGEENGINSGGRLAGEAKWSPDSDWVAYRLKGNHGIQLWLSHRAGKEQRQLTSVDGNVQDFVWSKSGDVIYFHQGPSRQLTRELMRKEADAGFLFDYRFRPGFSVSPVLFGKTQDSVLFGNTPASELQAEDKKLLWVADILNGVVRAATYEEREHYSQLTANETIDELGDSASILSYAESDAHGRIAWLANKNPEEYKGYSPPVRLFTTDSDGEKRRCDFEQCLGRIEEVIWSKAGDEVYFLRREGPNLLSVGLYAWLPALNTIRTISQTNDLLTDCERAIARLICIHESSVTPRKLISIDPLTGDSDTLFDPNPEFKNIKLTKVERLQWKEQGGYYAAGDLVYPSNYVPGRRYPLVIVQYRTRGFLRGGTGNEYPIHPLAAHGFFVLSFERPERREFSVRIGDPWELERHFWGEDIWEKSSPLSALEIIIAQLSSDGLVDPTRVGITGLSDGAETLWYALIHSDSFAAAATSDGGWSPSWYYLYSAETRKNYYSYAAGLPSPASGVLERWKQISPEFHADSIDTPVLVQVSDSELVPSAPAIGALQDAGQPIEAYVFPGEYHLKWQPKHKLAVYNRTIDWFNFWLRDIEDDNREKASQYERWREMRERRDQKTQALN